MIKLSITGNTLCNEAIALEKKKRNGAVQIPPLVARHRMNIQGLAGSEFTTSDKIIQNQRKEGYRLAAIHLEYTLDHGIHGVSTWSNKDTDIIYEMHTLKTSIALALRSDRGVYIDKHLFEWIKCREVVKQHEKYIFKGNLFYRPDMISTAELKDLLHEYSVIDNLATVEIIERELRKRAGNDTVPPEESGGHSYCAYGTPKDFSYLQNDR